MNKISIILPFYNASKYIRQSIDSVLYQTFYNWELLLINDGSTDESKELVSSYTDSRIKYFEQVNKGVSAARNLGLANMNGDYFCFLDADDILPVDSLRLRLELFAKKPELSFVDGTITVFDKDMKVVERVWQPSLHGNPLIDLVRQSGKSFFNPSWLIKIKSNYYYELNENLTHCEDLLFYLNITRNGGKYGYVAEPTLNYRNNPDSAMKNLYGLERGYRFVEEEIANWKEFSRIDKFIFSYKWRRAMFLSYLRVKNFLNAIKIFL